MFKTLLIAAAGAALIAGSASAQSYAPPMDMSWAFTSQAQNDTTGRAMVNRYQAQILAALAKARAEGHPFNGVIMPQNNPNPYVPNNNGTATINAIEGWDLQAIRDCARHDQYGHTWYVC